MTIEELNLSEEQTSAVRKLVQSAEDRVRTDYAQKLKDVRAELAKYKPVEKSEAEKELEKRISDLEAREQAFADKTRAADIADKMKSKGLPVELAQYLNLGDDIDSALDNVGVALGNYVLGASNKPSGHSKNKGVTKEQFRQMGYAERVSLFQGNPELYNTLK